MRRFMLFGSLAEWATSWLEELVSLAPSLHQWDTNVNRRVYQAGTLRCEGRALAHCQVQVRGVVGAEAVRTAAR